MTKSIIIMFAAFLFNAAAFGIVHSAPLVHTVKQGDSLCSIAKKYNINVYKLKSQNNLKVNNLSIGQQIIIKSDAKDTASVEKTQKHTLKTKSAKTKKGTKTVQVAEVITTNDNDEFIEYRTKKGDTIDKLAIKYNVDKEDILEANNLAGKKIMPGKIILIPKVVEEKVQDEEFITFTGKTIKTWKSNEEKYMLVKVAKSFIGAPYRYGGESVRGLDCSAYVKKIYDIFDVSLPRSAREQFHAGEKISKEELAVGDLVFFRTKRYIKYPTHVGIYIGEGRFIHSSSGQNRLGVKIDSLSSDFYGRTYVGAVRVKKAPEESADSKGASEKTVDNS